MTQTSSGWQIWAPSLLRTLFIPLCAAAYLGVTAWQNYWIKSSQPVFPEFDLPQVGAPGVHLTKAKAISGPQLVVFWATWCTPCQKQRQVLDPWISKGQRQSQVLGIATMDSPEQVEASESSYPHLFPSVLDQDGRIAGSLGIEALPLSLIVDKNGRVTRRFTGPLTPSDLQIIDQQLNPEQNPQ